MMISRLLFSMVLFFSPFQAEIEKDLQITEDLSPQLRIFKDNTFLSSKDQHSRAVHLSLDLSLYHGRTFIVESKKVFYVFINSTFARKGSGRLLLNADSLRNKYSNSIFISIYQRKRIDDLSIKCATPSANDEWYNPTRPALAFSNFILATSLILCVFFTALFRTNPQLTLDYLNLARLFYLRDREENQITLRITSSVNLLFYLFCSLLASLALMTALHFSQEGLSFLK